MAIYLCGPINGRPDAECVRWREIAKRALENTIDPMRRDYRGRERESVCEIVEQDKADICTSSGLLVYFDRPSVGTSMEVLLAWQMHKPIVVVYVSDAPPSPWLVYHSTHIVPNLVAGILLCQELLG